MKGVLVVATIILVGLGQDPSCHAADGAQDSQAVAREFVRNQIGDEYLEEIYQQAAEAASLSFQVAIQPALKRGLTEREKSRLIVFWHARTKSLLPYERLEEVLVPLVTKFLTSEEIKEINTFYATPVGRKLTKMLPAFTREAQAAGEELGRKFADKEWQARTAEELKAEFPQFFPEASEKE